MRELKLSAGKLATFRVRLPDGTEASITVGCPEQLNSTRVVVSYSQGVRLSVGKLAPAVTEKRASQASPIERLAIESITESPNRQSATAGT